MGELIFCCPRCLAIDTTGIEIASQRTIERIHCLPTLITCKHCKRLVSFSVNNALISRSFEAPGRFSRLAACLPD
jgi:hypothetical protein